MANIPPDLQEALDYYQALGQTPPTLGQDQTPPLTSLAGAPPSVPMGAAAGPVGLMSAGAPIPNVLRGIDNSKDPNGVPSWMPGSQAYTPPPKDQPSDTGNDAALTAALQQLQNPTAQRPTVPLGGTGGHGDQSGAPPSFIDAQKKQQGAGKSINFADTTSTQASNPLQIPPTSTVTVPAHEVQLQSDRIINEAHGAYSQSEGAQSDMTKAQIAQNDAVTVARSKYEDQLRKAGDDLAKRHHEVNTKIDAALAKLQNSKIDPNHWMSQQSVGKRLLLGVTAGLVQAGMALTHSHGPNPVTEQIDSEIQRDIDAQKSNQTKQFSLFNALREQGLGDEQALAATQKYYLDAGQRAIETAAQNTTSPILAAKGKEAVAQIEAKKAETDSRMYGYQRATTGTVGGIPKAVADEAKELTLKGMEPNAALDTAYFHHTGKRLGSGDLPSVPTGKVGAGRSAGVQMEYQNNLNRYDAFLRQLDQAQAMVNEGGQISSARTAQGKTLLNAMAAELGYVNAGKSPNETELATAQSMLPSDLNSWQITGADKAKLAQVRKMIEEKRAALLKTGPQIASGGGFAPPSSEDEDAAAAGGSKVE